LKVTEVVAVVERSVNTLFRTTEIG